MPRREQFLALFLRHQLDVRAFIGSMIPDRDLQQDVFQDVALVLWERFDDYDAGKSFGAWARGIAANKILQFRHENRRFPMALPAEVIPALLAAYERTEGRIEYQREALEACLHALPERSRSVLLLRYEQGLPAQKIASLTGRTTDAVYQLLSRVRGRLAECVRRRLSFACAPLLEGALDGQ